MTEFDPIQKDNYSFDDFDFLELNKTQFPDYSAPFLRSDFIENFSSYQNNTPDILTQETNVFEPSGCIVDEYNTEMKPSFIYTVKDTKGKKKKKSNTCDNTESSENSKVNKRRSNWRIASRNYREKIKKAEEKLDNDILLMKILNESLLNEVKELRVVLKKEASKAVYFNSPLNN